jgi:predicted  nucleic acid-binding Zn-ribbon protein
MSEIGSQKKVISKLEDQGLELLEQQEALKKTLDSITSQKTTLDQTYASEWELVKDSLGALDAELSAAAAEREASIAALPPALAKRYTQIAERRAGQGIALLNKDVCGACKRILPPELCNRIAKGEIIETCPSCHRLLVSA